MRDGRLRVQTGDLIRSGKSVKCEGMHRRRLLLLSAVSGFLAVVGHAGSVFAQATAKGEATGLPLPRFVSLKSDRVNMRSGPGTDYPTLWVYRRVGLPVEVIKEFESWRQIRDSEGAIGWVTQSLLSGRRTVLVLPWEQKPGQTPPVVAVRADNRDSADAVAQVEAGVIANVAACDGRWCQIVVGNVRGYLQQNKVWGVYANETVR